MFSVLIMCVLLKLFKSPDSHRHIVSMMIKFISWSRLVSNLSSPAFAYSGCPAVFCVMQRFSRSQHSIKNGTLGF